MLLGPSSTRLPKTTSSSGSLAIVRASGWNRAGSTHGNRGLRQGLPQLPIPLAPDYLTIQSVPLHRNASRFLNQPANLSDGQLLRRIGAGVVVNLLVAHRAVEVVGPEAQGELGGLDAEHDPVSLDVREVIEHQPADRHRPCARRSYRAPRGGRSPPHRLASCRGLLP